MKTASLVFIFSLLLFACDPPHNQVEITKTPVEPQVKYDLNTVSYEELITIKGLKKNVAAKIIEFRKICRFKRLEDLLAVKGIGEKTFLRIGKYFHITQ